jgi:hypothetical protein
MPRLGPSSGKAELLRRSPKRRGLARGRFAFDIATGKREPIEALRTDIIEIASIRRPKEGKKVATVVAGDGRSFEIWPEKAAPLKIGERYDIEIETREFNGRPIRKITKAKPAQAANGNARSIAISSAPAGAELAFVSSTLNAFIAAGKIGLDARELSQATQLLRLLWNHTFGATTH